MEKYYENKRLILASLLVVGACGYLWYSSSLSSKSLPDGSDTTKSKKAKKSKKSSSKKSSSDVDPTKKNDASKKPDTDGNSKSSSTGSGIEDWEKIKKLPMEERKRIAEELKLAGNEAFKQNNLDLALEKYSDAIKCYDKDPVFYSNRAAVWGSFQDYEKVVSDATAALNLCPDYVKCYTRRAVAYEHLKNYHEAVMDYTAACILQNFEDDKVGASVDRALKALAEQRVEKEAKNFNQEFPSANFIRAYLQSYHERKLPQHIIDSVDEKSSDYELKLAFDCLSKMNRESYQQAYEHFKNAIKIGFPSTQQGKESEALAYEYIATFEMLFNDSEKSLKSINHSLSLVKSVPAYLKRSAIHIEAGKLSESEADFGYARELDPNDPDLYYQLAQVAFLQGEWATAAENYKKCISLDENFVLGHIQLGVTEYRQNRVEDSRRRFIELTKKYPNNSFVFNYYGEILLDLRETKAAIKMFDKAFEIEKSNSVADINVLPLVNKALALSQLAETPADMEKAILVCNQAASLDPLSDVAVGTLAQLTLQQGRTSDAMELFEANAKLARSVPEQIQAYTFSEAARTQYRIAVERPVVRQHLEKLARSHH